MTMAAVKRAPYAFCSVSHLAPIITVHIIIPLFSSAVTIKKH